MDKVFRYKIDHLIFWLLTIGFHAYTHSHLIREAGTGQFIMELVVRNGLLALVIYSNLLLIIPWISKNKNYFIGILLIVLSVLAYVLIKNAHDAYLYGYVLGNPARQSLVYNTYYNLAIVIFYLAFAFTLHLSKQWYVQQQLIRNMELEKLNAELEYLKAQINPHFLFNSLNTVFFQIEKENQVARETLSKFSDMLRYQLYECTGNEIAIEKEIRYLQNYVELQRLRKDENYSIRFTCSENMNHFSIPPLLLLPFIENAFKHVSHFSDRENEIKISLDKSDDQFQLIVYNTKEPKPNTNTGGIGLKNVIRRLELIYKDRYNLTISEKPETYEARLILKVTG